MNLNQAIRKNKQEVSEMEKSPILELYAIRDLKSDFAPPTAISNRDIAKRWFGRLIKNDVTMSYAPEDFDLYYIGDYNPRTGEVFVNKPELVCNGKEFE